jgi:hypothetical protein
LVALLIAFAARRAFGPPLLSAVLLSVIHLRRLLLCCSAALEAATASWSAVWPAFL